jgi:hypothetical protein
MISGPEHNNRRWNSLCARQIAGRIFEITIIVCYLTPRARFTLRLRAPTRPGAIRAAFLAD